MQTLVIYHEVFHYCFFLLFDLVFFGATAISATATSLSYTIFFTVIFS